MKKDKKNNIFRVLRLCLGLNLNEMAERCGLSAVYFSELELGKKTKPSEQTLQKIADACGLKIDTLRYFTESKTGESLDYQTHLLHSLESYAQSLQSSRSEDSLAQPEEAITIIERRDIMPVYSASFADLDSKTI